jgi:hypothetical protein
VPQDTDRRGEGVSKGGEEVRDGPNCRRENVSVDFSRGHCGAAGQQDGCVVSVGRNRARVRDWIQFESLRESLCAMCSEDVWCFGLTKSSLCDSRVVVYKIFEDHYYEKKRANRHDYLRACHSDSWNSELPVLSTWTRVPGTFAKLARDS